MKKPSGTCGYKKGGKVKKAVKVEGEKAAARLDKPSAFKRGGHVKKSAKTTVNVVIGGDKGAPAAPTMMPPPPAPPMMKPPGMKTGGKVPHMTAGAMSGEGRLQKTEIQKKK